MKKSVLLLILASMAITASACNGSDVTGTMTMNSSAKQETGNKKNKETTKGAFKDKTDDNNPDNLVTMEPAETTEANSLKSQEGQTDAGQSSADSSKTDSEETDFPGPDTAMLVNLRGDTTTVYQLADGRYMDRTNTVYTFDGVDTWTDQSGIEWNETAQTSEAEENVQDPYDLYSWDSETGTYIPYQQADGNGDPIGRGNGWYYYDDEAGAYMPW